MEARRAEAAACSAAAHGHDVVRRVRHARAAGQAQCAGLPKHCGAGAAVGRVAVDGVLVGPALRRVDAAPRAARQGAAVEAGRERHGTRRPLTTARRDGGNRADAKREVIIARIVADRPGAVYPPPVLRLGGQPSGK